MAKLQVNSDKPSSIMHDHSIDPEHGMSMICDGQTWQGGMRGHDPAQIIIALWFMKISISGLCTSLHIDKWDN